MDRPPEGGSGRRIQDLTDVRRALERAVRRLCPSWLAAQQDDIVQQAMLRIAKTLEAGEGNEPRSGSYLWKVAYTATLKEIHSARRRQEIGIQDAGDGLEMEVRSPDPERVTASREIGAAIRSCLGTMIEPRRLAVLLHLYGYGLDETATVLGWRAKRADNLLYRGLADLRKCLERKGVRP